LRKKRNNVNSIHFEAATLYFHHTRTHETRATTSINKNYFLSTDAFIFNSFSKPKTV